MTDTGKVAAAEVISVFGGGMRAEYDAARLSEFFAEPAYWPEALSPQPVFLTGPRGAGKTMALRALAYQGQDKRLLAGVSEWPYIGIYWRVGTAALHTFQGSDIDEREWSRIFGHYLNLVLLSRLLDFISAKGAFLSGLNHLQFDGVSTALGFEDSDTAEQLHDRVRGALSALEFYVNNTHGGERPPCSIAGLPLQYLVDELQNLPELAGKYLYVLIDEYELLLPYQQRIVNSLIRHTGDTLVTYKVGMRTSVAWDRRILDSDQTLDSPADFREIEIFEALTQGDFPAFAAEVCNKRLSLLKGAPKAVETLFPSLSAEAEGRLLGIERRLVEIGAAMSRSGASRDLVRKYLSLPPLDAYLLHYWAGGEARATVANLEAYESNPSDWARRRNNEQFAMLFTIRERSVGVRKYYAGWRTYALLADGNIRFFMQLVQEAIVRHLRSEGSLGGPISPEDQTRAAAAVGAEALRRIPSAGGESNALARLVLSLGRVFEVMARQPFGHTPEVTQFVWQRNGSPSENDRAEGILDLGVSNLALVRSEVDKRARVSGRTSATDQYQLHPIFAPYFQCSYRSKRHMRLSTAQLLALIDNPEEAVVRVLGEQRRTVTLSEVMAAGTLFEDWSQ